MMSLTSIEKIRVLEWAHKRCVAVDNPPSPSHTLKCVWETYAELLDDCAADCGVSQHELKEWDRETNFLPVNRFHAELTPKIEKLLQHYREHDEDSLPMHSTENRDLREYLIQCYEQRNFNIPIPQTDEERSVLSDLEVELGTLYVNETVRILDYLEEMWSWVPANPLDYLAENFVEDEDRPMELIEFSDLTNRHLRMIGDPEEGQFHALLLLPFLREKEAKLRGADSAPPLFQAVQHIARQGKEEESMSKKLVGGLTRTKEKLVPAAREGLNVAGAVAAKEVILTEVRKYAGEHYPEFFRTKIGKKVEPLALATAVHLMCEMFPDQIPQSVGLARNCERIVTDEFRQSGEELFHHLLPLMRTLAAELGSHPVAEDEKQ